ncbi:MAG: Wzz/FepE/Etk N-terminal domain-containing protein, partial [Chloroflexota bacterium]
MNLTYYTRILIRRGWILILAMAITAGAAYGLSKAQTPVYRATQRVLLQPARNDYGLTETLRILLRSYVVYLNTDTQAAAAIDRLQLDMTPGDLRRYTTISSDPTQLIVHIDVDMQDG